MKPHQTANEVDVYRPRRTCLALLGLALACTCGCMQSGVESYYGRHEIPAFAGSVNGTDVLAGMFEEAGHDVRFRGTLITTEMDSVDTIVWFPDDYTAPTDEVCEWFDTWLALKPGRTLVYVGRDFDAAPLYWQQMKTRVGRDQQRAYSEREMNARLDAKRPTKIPEEDLSCQWFELEPADPQTVTALSGRWARGIDAAKTEIQIGTRILAYRPRRRLLAGNGQPLVTRFAETYWEGSAILLVANGSFLLNLPLVNHENRKLAGKLIAATGPRGSVVFLESGPGGPPIDPDRIDNSLWTLLGAWPLNAILLQLALAGVIFCFARWPIFGRPKQPPAESTSDFALHVAAVGQLLARTKDRPFALSRATQADAPPREPVSNRGAEASHRTSQSKGS